MTVYAAGANESGGFAGKNFLAYLLHSLEAREESFRYRYNIVRLPDKLVSLSLHACFTFYRICHYMGYPPDATIYNTDTFQSFAIHLSHQAACMAVHPKVNMTSAPKKFFLLNYQHQNRLPLSEIKHMRTDATVLDNAEMEAEMTESGLIKAVEQTTRSAVDLTMSRYLIRMLKTFDSKELVKRLDSVITLDQLDSTAAMALYQLVGQKFKQECESLG